MFTVVGWWAKRADSRPGTAGTVHGVPDSKVLPLLDDLAIDSMFTVWDGGRKEPIPGLGQRGRFTRVPDLGHRELSPLSQTAM